MSWLSELFGGSSAPAQVVPPSAEQVANYYRQVKVNNPGYYEQIKENDPEWISGQQAAAAAPTPAPTPAPAPAPPSGGPAEALRKLNEAYGSDFESRYLPDTLDDPFISTALSGGRSKADEFISNMVKRGTLSDSGRAKAVAALDAQTPGVTSRLSNIGGGLLGTDRANLTNLANVQRGQASQTPEGSEFDPTPLVSQLASTGQGYAGSFGDRFRAAIPEGSLYDTSGIGELSGAVTGPQNISYDPYAVEGGKLKSGVSDDTEAPPPKKKRTTEVF